MNGDIIHDVRSGNELKRLAKMKHVIVSPKVKSVIKKLKDNDLVWVALEVNKPAIQKIEIVNSEWFAKNLFSVSGGYTGQPTCTT